MLHKGRVELQDYQKAKDLEWLETNGLGGWSGSTLMGCHTRRYHSILMAAVQPPAQRMSLVSKLDETVLIGDLKYELGTNNYGTTVHPTGFNYLTGFDRDIFPEFTYQAGGVTLKKTICMVHGENTVIIKYAAVAAPENFTIELLPLLSVRDYHGLMHANESVNAKGNFKEDVFSIQAYQNTPDIFIKIPEGTYEARPDWYYNFHYDSEQYRGLDYTEDLFSPGRLRFELSPGKTVSVVVSTNFPGIVDADILMMMEAERRESLLQNQTGSNLTRHLVMAADQFIVTRDIDLKTVIAGYHWFTDWGRDTMIALPGLCLATGRFEDAKKILAAFAGAVSQGMLPNRFQDHGEAPEYNNVDATLWYFIAIHKYLQATGDKDFVIDVLLSVLKDIIDWHFRGTRYNIHVAEDGLLYAGEKGQQLTWMDARIGDWVVTPRMGKPVEIQALWYNALLIFAHFLELNGQESDGSNVRQHAEKVKHSFDEKYWNESGSCLFDNIDENGVAVKEIRPNQLFAISLPFPLVEAEKRSKIIDIVRENLFTPVGLKSLASTDDQFQPHYGGDSWHRDSCYHQGTVWSWLLGPYIDALMCVQTNAAGIEISETDRKKMALSVINGFRYHLEEACIGSISEIFDGAIPHHPRGCIAQAWSVGEILRVIKEYSLDA